MPYKTKEERKEHYNGEEIMELEMLHEPSPKCPFCRDNYGIGKHLIARRTILGDLVYDCPECHAVYQEKEEKTKNEK